MKVSDVHPGNTPDLFVGRPVIVTGRFSGEPGPVLVRGKVGDRWEDVIASARQGATHAALPSVWARRKIAHLADNMLAEAGPAPEFGLMSAFTAFVAVDEQSETEGAHGVTVAVPVPVPEGVRYDTTVMK